ncbi:ABC transporter permease [Nordella sp. HKS 07]|uniref:ABC transporter permease n=1 Tax=Nordella sp. HKS 07 TaxID=2712222 RepID=UPI00352C0C61
MWITTGWRSIPRPLTSAHILVGTAIYLFGATSLGIMLATVANSTPQFALLSIPVFVLMFLLSGSFTPFESMPRFLHLVMGLSPSTGNRCSTAELMLRWCGGSS